MVVNVDGDIFVRERSITGIGPGGISLGGNARVQKFDSAGRFQLMFGGEVNKTVSAEVASTEAERNRCTSVQLDGGDECGVGTEGSGQGQFGASFSEGIALGATGKLFVPDIERIQRFDAEGEYEGSVTVAAKTLNQLAIAPGSGDFYAAVQGRQNIQKLDAATGAEIVQLKGLGGGAELVATDPAGNVFSQDGRQILEFDSQGNPLSPSACCGASPSRLAGLATNAAGSLYVNYSFQAQQSGAALPSYAFSGQALWRSKPHQRCLRRSSASSPARWVATTPC